MDSSVDQRLSLLLDGEASEFETRRLVEDISKNPHIKKRWLEMNKQKAALRRELLMPNVDLSSKIQNELHKSKKIKNQNHHFRHFSWGKLPYTRTCSYLFGLCFTLTFLFFEFSPQPNKSLFQASAPKTQFQQLILSFLRILAKVLMATFVITNSSQTIKLKLIMELKDQTLI